MSACICRIVCYHVSVYIETIANRSSPPAILLREGYRQNGKVVKRTVANLSHWDPQLVEHFRVLLKGGVAVESASSLLTIDRALPHGHVAAVLGAARGLGRAHVVRPGAPGLAAPAAGHAGGARHLASFQAGHPSPAAR